MDELVIQVINNMGHPVLIADFGIRLYAYSRVIDSVVYNVDMFIGSTVVHRYRYFAGAAMHTSKFQHELSYTYEGHVPVICNPVDDEAFLLLWEELYA